MKKISNIIWEGKFLFDFCFELFVWINSFKFLFENVILKFENFEGIVGVNILYFEIVWVNMFVDFFLGSWIGFGKNEVNNNVRVNVLEWLKFDVLYYDRGEVFFCV